MPALDPADILDIAVYPPIGIARVGNAEGADDCILAPQVVGGVPPGDPRDGEGRLKRQAVRFHVYARMRAGGVRELTLDDGAAIEWRVAVANLKAGWYEFNNAMDLPDGQALSASRRNRRSSPRNELDIVPPPVTIGGRDRSGEAYEFRGEFLRTPVFLGEARTDAQGRLVFLGGRGAAASVPAGARPLTFANNDRWHDDVSDGPVRATVTIGGRRIEARPAHVVVTPPNFAPGLFGVVTMADVADACFVAAGWAQAEAGTRFTRDVWPIFDRLSGLQWVNHGLFVAHGAGSPLDARDPRAVARLADASPAARPWRERVLQLFRDPSAGGALDRLRLPYLYGDAYGEHFDAANAMLAVTQRMYGHLSAWAAGDFTADWDGIPALPVFDALPPEDQVHHLERAGLHECLGGPFHPGIELTWIMRRPSLWEAPYRLRTAPEGVPVRQDYGDALTPGLCLGDAGPLTSAGPGSLTRWLGVPWHTDAASCNSAAEYAPSTFLSMPSFWGARVPNQVLSAASWRRASDPANGRLQAAKHFADRVDWTRDINGRDYYDRINAITTKWWQLGLVKATDGQPPANLRELGVHAPAYVESGRPPETADAKPELIGLIEDLGVERAAPAALIPAGPLSPAPPAGKQYGEPRVRFRRGEV